MGSSPSESVAGDSAVLRGGSAAQQAADQHYDFVTAEVLRAAVQADAPHLRMREVLGEGGMAVVFAATHLPLELAVAVKVLRAVGPHRHEMAARLLNEGKLCAMLSEVGAPRVLDARMLRDGTPYVVMERIAGTLLSDMLDAGPIDAALALQIADGLLTALSAVHAARIVHRDVKPANIILEPRPHGAFRVRLIDFGVATLMDAQAGPYGVGETNATQTGAVVGTPDYVAPEQLLGRKADGRADVYATAATLFHMLTGTPPFKRTHLHLAIAATLRDPLPHLTDLCPHLPHTLEGVLSAALSRDVNSRTPSAEALQYALRNVFNTVRDPLPAGPTHFPAAHPQVAAGFGIAAASAPVLAVAPTVRAEEPATADSRIEVARAEAAQAAPLQGEASGARRTLALDDEDAPSAEPRTEPLPDEGAPKQLSGRRVRASDAPRGLKVNFEDDARDGDEMALIFPRRRGGLAAAVILGLLLSSAGVLVWVERVHPERLPKPVAVAIDRLRVGGEQLSQRFGISFSIGTPSAQRVEEAPALERNPTPVAVTALPGSEPNTPAADSTLAATAGSTVEGTTPEQPVVEQPVAEQAARDEAVPAGAVPDEAAPADAVPAGAVVGDSAHSAPVGPSTPAIAASAQEPANARRRPNPRRTPAAPADAPLVGRGFALSPVLEGIDSQLRGTAKPAPAPAPDSRAAASPLVDNPY